MVGPMTARHLLAGNTQVPKWARDVSAEVWRELESAEVALHAGDCVDERLLDVCEMRARVEFGHDVEAARE
jgi:uncharacterized protein